MTVVALIFVNRSFSASLLAALQRPNIAHIWVLATVTAILSLTLLLPVARNLFRFGPLHWDETLVGGVAVLVALEALKPIWLKSSDVNAVPAIE